MACIWIFFEASEMRATCALCHTVDFGVLFLRSNLLRTYQKSKSASFFVPARTLITPKLLTHLSVNGPSKKLTV